MPSLWNCLGKISGVTFATIFTFINPYMCLYVCAYTYIYIYMYSHIFTLSCFQKFIQIFQFYAKVLSTKYNRLVHTLQFWLTIIVFHIMYVVTFKYSHLSYPCFVVRDIKYSFSVFTLSSDSPWCLWSALATCACFPQEESLSEDALTCPRSQWPSHILK